jgi:uncharacterized protein (DUF302 family)
VRGKVRIETKPFSGARITVHTSCAFDDVLHSLRSLMGAVTVGEIVALAKEPISEAEFARLVEERYVGKSGFMLFAEIDHSGWLPKYGITQRTVRWIIGNPLYAVTMIRHDITAGLFAPVELLVTEGADRSETTVTYVRPSSLTVIEENPPLLAAAQSLDNKLAALVAEATDSVNQMLKSDG